jgi:D-tyrosyl-tRNA(Tyr) deacylase
MRHAVFVFCIAPEKDPVAGHVLDALKAECSTHRTETVVDGRSVLRVSGVSDAELSIVSTDEVVSHDYARYMPIFNERFGDADVIGIVNWHEGANAPNSIFTVQTTGDLATGAFSPVDPQIARSLLLAIENERVANRLEGFRSYMEATHWSGVKVGQPGSLLAELKPSVIDIEIGSSPADWTNPLAAGVLARALLRIFERSEEPVRSVLCMGGVHFEPSFTDAVLQPRAGLPVAASHVLPNHWLVSEGYDRESRLADLKRCVDSIRGGIQGIVHHDKLKAPYKGIARSLADGLGIPLISHKKLRAEIVE